MAQLARAVYIAAHSGHHDLAMKPAGSQRTKVHYMPGGGVTFPGRSACGQRDVFTTEDRKDVTCNGCLRVMAGVHNKPKGTPCAS